MTLCKCTNDGAGVAIIGRLQWLISLTVLVYGVALFGGLGVTAIFFVGIGLSYCLLAAWASRLTLLPALVALLADCPLVLFSWRLLTGSFESVPLNAAYQGREVHYLDYLALDSVASFIILVLVTLYIMAVVLKWKALSRRAWF